MLSNSQNLVIELDILRILSMIYLVVVRMLVMSQYVCVYLYAGLPFAGSQYTAWLSRPVGCPESRKEMVQKGALRIRGGFSVQWEQTE